MGHYAIYFCANGVGLGMLNRPVSHFIFKATSLMYNYFFHTIKQSQSGYIKNMSPIIEQRTHFVRGCIYALTGAFLWGFSGVCAEVLVEDFHMTPAFITMIRALIAGAGMLAVALVRRRARIAKMLTDKKTLLLLLASGSGIYMSQFAYAQSVAYTNAGTATVLQSPACVLVMLVVCFELKRAPGKYQVIGVILALVGTWLIATGGDPSTLALPPEGLFWGAINSIAIAVYILIPRTLFERWGSSCPIALSMVVNAFIGVFVFFFFKPAVSGATQAAPLFTPWSITVLVIGNALLGTILAFSFYLHGCALVGSVTASLIGAIEPVSAMFLAVLLLGNVMGWADWVGLILMVAMICLIALPAEGNSSVDKAIDIPKRKKRKANA